MTAICLSEFTFLETFSYDSCTLGYDSCTVAPLTFRMTLGRLSHLSENIVIFEFGLILMDPLLLEFKDFRTYFFTQRVAARAVDGASSRTRDIAPGSSGPLPADCGGLR
jgi:hypothetical protein